MNRSVGGSNPSGLGWIVGQPAGIDKRKVALHTLLLVGVMLLASALRLYGLDRTSLWADEGLSVEQARRPFMDMIFATASDNYPPLHNLILFVVIRLFGATETTLRLPSALLGIANVYLLYLLGRALWDRMTGLLAALLLTLCGFAVWYSQEVRMYALLGLTATAYMLTVLMLLDRPGRGRIALCVAAGTAMLYSHPYAAFLWAGVNLAMPLGARLRADWPRIDWRSWLLSQGITAGIFLPWFVLLVIRLRHLTHGFWVSYPTPAYLLGYFDSLAGGRIALVGFAVLMLLSFLRLESPPSGRDGRAPVLDLGWRQLLLLVWLLAPLAVGYLISVIASPILISRYLICSLPAMMLLAAHGLRRLAFHRLVLAAAVLAAIAWSLPKLYDSVAVRQRNDFRSAAAAVTREYRPGDHILFYRGYVSAAFLYYFHVSTPYTTKVLIPDPKVMNLADNERVWIVISSDSHGDGLDILDKVGPAHVQAARYSFPGVEVFLFVPKSG